MTTTFSDREPFDHRRDFFDTFLRILEEDDVLKHTNDQLTRCHEALGILALLHRFDKEDLALIALLASGDRGYADDLAAQLEEETGVQFHLTPKQWGVIHSELGA